MNQKSRDRDLFSDQLKNAAEMLNAIIQKRVAGFKRGIQVLHIKDRTAGLGSPVFMCSLNLNNLRQLRLGGCQQPGNVLQLPDL